MTSIEELETLFADHGIFEVPGIGVKRRVALLHALCDATDRIGRQAH